MESKMEKRETWMKKREYFLAVAGNVVGLGNVWRFPYLCYKNGGGVFLFPYLIFAVLCGLPLFLLETVIGQYTQEGAITCWTKICPLAKGIGYSINVIQVYATIYILILAWALLYLISSFRGTLPWATCSNPWNTDRCVELTSANWTALHNGNLTANWTSGNLTKSSVSEFWERGVLSMSGGIDEIGTVKWELLLCLLACWVACYFCIWKGVRSTGKVVYVTAVFPYVMLVILLVRGLTLPGAWQGVVYYLYPEPSRLADLQVWMEAGTQVLFSYGVGAGTLTTLGSYNKFKNNCYRDSLWLCLLNSCTSFIAGFAVFSALGFMAQAQGIPINMVVDSGPGLAFIAFPQAAAMMPLPQLWAACFFIMLILLGLDTTNLLLPVMEVFWKLVKGDYEEEFIVDLMHQGDQKFTGLETITSSVIDLFPETMRRPWRREILLLLLCSVCFILHILLTTQGGIYLFQLIDYYGASGACITCVSLVQCVAVGWVFGAERMCDAVEEMTGQRPWLLFKLCWCCFTPLICMVGFIGSFVDYQPLTFGNYVYPDWSYYLGWAIALSSIIVIPIWAIGKICLTKGSLRQRLLVLCHPDSDHVGPKTNKENLLSETEIIPMSAPLPGML